MRLISVRDNVSDFRDVYQSSPSYPLSVCHLKDSDTLLVCERLFSSERNTDWLVAVRRSGSEWRETHRLRLQTDFSNELMIICALSGSRVLVGQWHSEYLELLRVEVAVAVKSGARIAPVCRLDVTAKYRYECATCASDTLVVMSFAMDQSVGLYRLRGDRCLEELAHIILNAPCELLWRADRLLVAEWNEATKSHAVDEFEVSGARIERRRQLIAANERIQLRSWCAVDGGLAITDLYSEDLLLHYLLV